MIFVPRKNIYTRLPRWQRGSVSVTSFANAAQQNSEGTSALNTTVTVSNGIYDADVTTSGTDFARVYGFDGGVDILGVASFGSMAEQQYIDNGSTLRTIMNITWSDTGVSGTPAGETDNIYFGITGTSVPDSNTTFSSFTYNSVSYTRSSATTYTASVGGVNTFWQWDNVTPNGPTSGTPEFILFIG